MMLSLLIEAALRTLMVALAVGAGLRLLRVSNVMAQKKAWGLVLAAALLMPLLMRWQWLSASALIRVPGYPKAQRVDSRPAEVATAPTTTHGQAALTKADPAPLSAGHFVAPADLSTNEPVQSNPATFAPRQIPIATLLWLLYLGVAALLLARLAYGLAAVLRLWTTSEPVCLTVDSDLAAGMRLRSSWRIASPVALATGVVLPSEYLQWDRHKLRIVLAHECAHIRQGDFFVQLFAGLHAALFWFTPLSWWLKYKLSDLSEAVSDRAGLEAAASRASYAQILLEFAALPRPTPSLGVAMAHKNNLSVRIEHFLNESLFHQAFAGSRRRAFLAVLLVPIAIFAFTALIRVEAAAAPAVAAQAQPGKQMAQEAQSSDASSSPIPAAPVTPPTLPSTPEITSSNHTTQKNSNARHGSYKAYSSSTDSGSYAAIHRDQPTAQYEGDWAERLGPGFAKANKMAKGDFFWFTHKGNSYLLEDKAVVAEVLAMQSSVEELGKEQEELGRRQELLGKQMEEEGRKMEKASIPTPDMSKEIDDLEKQMSKLRTMQGKTMTTEEWADLESKLGNLQGKLGLIEGEIGAKQGALGGEMGKLGDLMGELGGKQGLLGTKQGRLSEEAERKINAIIEKALKEGKARPVE
ncbi:MAG: M56 family metallopeptidase [Terracidiphilus sp.]